MRCEAPTIARLPDGARLHFSHGPIDLVLRAYGEADAVDRAYRAAARRFDTLLDELCAELESLRRGARADDPELSGPVARRMQRAVAPFAERTFITPMAAVAGAVADAILAVMREAAPLTKAFVNNGGDIAVHCGEGESFAVGLIDRPDRPSLFGRARIRGGDEIGGIATSGWRGRSFSLGIADAVTILASDAAAADAAATIVANAVDLPGHPGVTRVPAHDLHPDSDLGPRAVTRAVARLTALEVDEALERGLEMAARLVREGLIRAAALHLHGETRVAGALRDTLLPESLHA